MCFMPAKRCGQPAWSTRLRGKPHKTAFKLTEDQSGGVPWPRAFPSTSALTGSIPHYQDQYGNPWDGTLTACQFDANDMQAIAASQGFETRLLLSEQAMSDAVVGAITC
jgi:Tfp pilus tip-associated adhesin PilY1